MANIFGGGTFISYQIEVTIVNTEIRRMKLIWNGKQ